MAATSNACALASNHRWHPEHFDAPSPASTSSSGAAGDAPTVDAADFGSAACLCFLHPFFHPLVENRWSSFSSCCKTSKNFNTKIVIIKKKPKSFAFLKFFFVV